MADEAPRLRPTSSLRLRTRVLLALLVVPLIVVPAIAYFALSANDGGARIALAQGGISGSFHPIAGSFVADDTRVDECAGEWSCLEQAFGNLAYRQGPRRALAVFEKQLETDESVRKNCHRIAHTIGSAAYERFDRSVAKTFAAGGPACASGYYHGILERAFVGVDSKAELTRTARTLCSSGDVRRRGFLDYQCRHGLGHGLMIQTGYDLPTALRVCSELGTGWDEVSCTGGVFMENVSTRFGFRSRWLSDSDPLYPCTTVALRHRRSCFVRAATWALELNDNDFGAAARACESAGPRWARFCFHGFGRDAVVGATYARLPDVLARCRVTGRYMGECLYGAARTLGDGAGLAGARRAAELCRRAPSAERDTCTKGFGLVVGLLYPTDGSRRAACAQLTREHVDACAAAAKAEVDPSGRDSWG
jgi:hypothetical protein